MKRSIRLCPRLRRPTLCAQWISISFNHVRCNSQKAANERGRKLVKNYFKSGEALIGDLDLDSLDARSKARRMIHVLGISNTSVALVACLRMQPNPPPVTMFTHLPAIMEAWEKAGRTISLVQDGKKHIIRGVELELQKDTLPENQSKSFTRAPRSNSKIYNLIWSTRPSVAEVSLSKIKSRLSDESTIFAVTNGMGVLEHTIANFFPEPWNRPGFFEGSSSIEMRQGSDASDRHRGSSEWVLGKDIFTNLEVGGVSFHVTSFKESGDAVVLRIGPPAIIPGDAHGMHAQRQRLASYLLHQLNQAPLLDFRQVGKRDLQLSHWKRLLIDTTLGTLSCLFGRRTGKVLSDTAGRDRCLQLFDEAFNVMQRMVPDVSRERCLEWVMFYLVQNPNHISKMAKLMQEGRALDIGATNQWLIARAHERNIPVPECEKTVEELIAKAEKLRIEWETMRAAQKARREKKEAGLQGQVEKRREQDAYRMDPLEEKRRNKAIRKREKIGKQEMSSHISSPQIQPMGESSVRHLQLNSNDEGDELEKSQLRGDS